MAFRRTKSREMPEEGYAHQSSILDNDRKRRSGKVAPVVIALAVVVCFALLSVVAVWMARVDHSLSLGSEGGALTATLSTPDESSESKAFYVLLVGSDAREDETRGRGDALILARIDPSEALITLVSVPRDTIVNIAGAEGPQKINATYIYGGPSTAVYELSRFCGVPISHYVEVDFDGLEDVVDRLGGITVDVPEAVTFEQSGGGVLEAGQQRLDGATALAYARERYGASGGDFARARAQRLIVKAIISQILQASPVEMPSLVGSLSECVKTDYTVAEALPLVMKFRGRDYTVYSTVCPSYSFEVDGVSYDGTMFADWRDMMKRVDAGLDPNDLSVPIPEPQASNEKLGEAANSAAPQDYGELVTQNLNTVGLQ
ncbi:MAG: LCP family protein [Atopobiaceae bacterium]|nr:LCP family protein [Atopobiaceae bacterium]